ncbi:hypothetical protein [Corynebacterium nuruki]|uniref:hypothetical protein n=1 Tax=Corynebacterium nuruki TaxID=1032851 RepID=UPI0039BF3150
MPPTQPHQTAAYQALPPRVRTVHNKAVRYCLAHHCNALTMQQEQQLGVTVRDVGTLLDAGVWQVVSTGRGYAHKINDIRLNQGGEQQ